ncbi:MAG TPA: DUF2203 domain-containing protein [Planctomycetaceae bacterium]
MAAKEKKKYFTIDEANNALPLVRAIVGDIVAKYSEVSERKSRLDQIRESRSTRDRGSRDLYGEELAQVEELLEKEIGKLQEFIDELEKLGIELKDISRGLIDFPSLMDGREVYLCWLLGEEEIGHWHEIDAGFAGRQSLLAGSASEGNPEGNGTGEE